MELTDVDLQTIRERAYFKWLDAGAPCCDGVDYWLGAECEYLHDDGRIEAERAAANQRDKVRLSTRKANQRVQRSLAEEEETIGSLD
jgi:hypothetical protein